MTTALKPTSYTKREFETIVEELTDVVKKTRPEDWSDFFESTLGTTLIELLGYVGDIVSFNIDSVATEIFLATARRYESALRFAQSVGYRPRGPVAAAVTVTIDEMPAEVTTNGALITKGEVFTGANGRSYELLDDVVIPAGSTTASLLLTEGAELTETFDTNNLPNQTVQLSSTGVADGSWEVFVGDPSDPLNRWVEVENLALRESTEQVYTAQYAPNGSVVFTFGDGSNAGKIPDGEITVRFRRTTGTGGNTSGPGNVTGAVTAALIETSGTVQMSFTSSTAARGGIDRESLEEMRVNIPAFLRSSDRVVTRDDYDLAIRRVPGIALGFADILQASYATNLVIIYAWASEAVDMVVSSGSVAQDTVVPYTRYAQISGTQPFEIQQFLRDRTMVTVHNAVATPDQAYVDIYLAPVVYDQRFEPQAVHAAIVTSLVSLFENSSGFLIRLSDIYAAIDNATGVLSCLIDRILFSHVRKAKATGSIQVTSLVGLEAQSITIDDKTGGFPRTFEFDDNGAVAGGSVLVQIGGTIDETVENLTNAINGHVQITARQDDNDPSIINLTHQLAGADFNEPITSTGGPVAITGMSGGDDTLALTHEDYRRDVAPPVDPWPSGGSPLPVLPPAHPDFATQSGDAAGSLPYLPLQDVRVQAAVDRRQFYDDSFLYNNEILYNGGIVLDSAVQAINLRGLFFELVKG